jgi:hypothetical protein
VIGPFWARGEAFLPGSLQRLIAIEQILAWTRFVDELIVAYARAYHFPVICELGCVAQDRASLFLMAQQPGLPQ